MASSTTSALELTSSCPCCESSWTPSSRVREQVASGPFLFCDLSDLCVDRRGSGSQLGRELVEVVHDDVPTRFNRTVIAVWPFLRSRNKRRPESQGFRRTQVVLVRGHHHDVLRRQLEQARGREVDLAIRLVVARD